jgi:DNA-binding XRE family transcriptional regulator
MPFKKIDVKAIIQEELKNDEFRASYERLKNEYDLIDQIVKARKKLNVTQMQLSKLINVSQQAISRIEREKHIPKMDTLMKIVEGLGLKITLSER